MNIKYKLLIIAGALGVTGAAIGGALYLAYPVQVSTLGGSDAQLSYFLVRTSRHDNDGIELSLQRHRGRWRLRLLPSWRRRPRPPEIGRAITEH